MLKEIRRGWPDALEIMKALPPLTKRLIEQVQDGTLRLPLDTRALDQIRREAAAQARRSDRIVVGATLLLGGVIWLAAHLQPRLIGLLFGTAGLVLWFAAWVVAGPRRRGPR